MFPSLDRSCAVHERWRARLRLSCATAALGFAAVVLPAFAAVPENLGNGLGLLVESRLATSGLTGTAAADAGPFDGYTSVQAAATARMAITDAQGRFLVRVNPDGSAPIEALAANLHALIPSVDVTAIDTRYRKVGVMDAYVGIDDVSTLATTAGVRSVILELKPRHAGASAFTPDTVNVTPGPSAANGDTFRRLGSVFDQGVTQHRVDRINRFYNAASASADYEGAGMSIGFISNSYAASSPAADVNRFDLPGAANNPVNTTPVVVLEDDPAPGSDDEGRAMVEIGYKMAPKATLAFATANFGEVDFAKNIRALAGIKGSTYPGQTFAADTICDDVGYFDEPFFQDGIVGGGVNDAAAAGVAYFSSAANDVGINGYESDLRWVPNGSGLTAAAGNTALAGSNIDLTNVPPELYAGGFHNFNPNVGQLDVAQTVNVSAGTGGSPPPTILQWNEPYDQTTEPDLVMPAIFTGSGTITPTQQTVNFPVAASLTAGTLYELDANAAAGSAVDVIVTVTDPNGNPVIDHQDNAVDEVVRFFAPTTGSGYSITITPCCGSSGAFNLSLYATHGFTGPAVKTRISLLAFTTAGVFVPGSSLTENNLATNEPIQIGGTYRVSGSGSQLQFVFARANVASGADAATHIRYLIPGNGAGGIGPAEYFSYNTVTTSGHAMALGTNGTAAYSVFRPSLPEPFSSPGPIRIYFDDDGNRLPIPQIRQQPRIAAADDASNTVLAPNFSGTSAAGPHAAAIAALVLEAHGGRHSVTPTQMTDLLEHSTFPHDLDPSASAGVARTASGNRIAIRIASDGSNNAGTGGMDTNAFTVTYTGSGSLATLVFNPAGTATTAGNVSGGSVNVTNVSGSDPAMVKFVETDAPGTVFAPSGRPFTIGSQSTITGANVAAAFSNPAPAPSTTQSWTMTLTFVADAFTQDKVLHYSVGRAEQHSTNNTTTSDYLADLFGGGVSLPSGDVNAGGMAFSGTTSTGEAFSGTIQNRIGAGYSPVDGFGFINAEQAVSAPIP